MTDRQQTMVAASFDPCSAAVLQSVDHADMLKYFPLELQERLLIQFCGWSVCANLKQFLCAIGWQCQFEHHYW